jgi:hypothetical protein
MKTAIATLAAVLLGLFALERDVHAQSLYPTTMCCQEPLVAGSNSCTVSPSHAPAPSVGDCLGDSPIVPIWLAMAVNAPLNQPLTGVSITYQSPSPNPIGVCLGSATSPPVMSSCATLALNGSTPVYTPSGGNVLAISSGAKNPSPAASANTVFYCAPPVGGGCPSGLSPLNANTCCSAGAPLSTAAVLSDGTTAFDATISTPYALSGQVPAPSPGTTPHSTWLTAAILLLVGVAFSPGSKG